VLLILTMFDADVFPAWLVCLACSLGLSHGSSLRCAALRCAQVGVGFGGCVALEYAALPTVRDYVESVSLIAPFGVEPVNQRGKESRAAILPCPNMAQ